MNALVGGYEVRRKRAETAALAFALALGGCATDPGAGPATEKEVRPTYRPGPSTGELFEGQIRVHTRGMQGDALCADVSPLGDLIACSWDDHQKEPKVFVVPTAGGPSIGYLLSTTLLIPNIAKVAVCAYAALLVLLATPACVYCYRNMEVEG